MAANFILYLMGKECLLFFIAHVLGLYYGQPFWSFTALSKFETTLFFIYHISFSFGSSIEKVLFVYIFNFSSLLHSTGES